MLSPAVSTATAEPPAPEPSGLIPRARQHAGPSPSMGPPDTTFLPSRSRSRSSEQGSNRRSALAGRSFGLRAYGYDWILRQGPQKSVLELHHRERSRVPRGGHAQNDIVNAFLEANVF